MDEHTSADATPPTIIDVHEDPPPAKAEDTEYGESSAKIWSVYVNATEKYDKALVESWKGDMDGILIFAGLFSGCVTAFLVESSKLLQDNQAATTTAILSRISLQLAAASDASQAPVPPFDPNADTPLPAYALRVNILWFLSLLLSLLCALCATLIQGWARNYLHAIEHHTAPHRRARIRAFLFHGIEQWQAKAIVEGVPTLLHVSLFCFIAGIQQYVTPFNQPVSLMALIILCIYVGIYVGTSVLSVIRLSCPYQTPLSAALWHVKQLVWPLKYLDFRMQTIIVTDGRNLANGRSDFAMNSALQSENDDVKALSWTISALYEDSALHTFIDGIPGYLKSKQVLEPTSTVLKLLTQKKLGLCISQFLETCLISPNSLPSDMRKQRVITCFQAISALLVKIGQHLKDKKWTSCFPASTVTVFANLARTATDSNDSATFLHASSTTTLMFWVLLDEYEQLVMNAKEKLLDIQENIVYLSKIKNDVSYQVHFDGSHIKDGQLEAIMKAEIKQKFQHLKHEGFISWGASMFDTLEQLHQSSLIFQSDNIYQPANRSNIDLFTQCATAQAVYQGVTDEQLIMKELCTSQVPVLKSVLEYFYLHSEVLNEILNMNFDKDLNNHMATNKLKSFLDSWCSYISYNNIWPMITAAHISNFIQLICIAINNSTTITKTEATQIIDVLKSIEISNRESRVTDKMAKYLIVMVDFLKYRYIEFQHDNISPDLQPQGRHFVQSFLWQVAELAISFATKLIKKEEMLIQLQSAINGWQKECPEITDIVIDSVKIINDRIESHNIKIQRALLAIKNHPYLYNRRTVHIEEFGSQSMESISDVMSYTSLKQYISSQSLDTSRPFIATQENLDLLQLVSEEPDQSHKQEQSNDPLGTDLILLAENPRISLELALAAENTDSLGMLVLNNLGPYMLPNENSYDVSPHNPSQPWNPILATEIPSESAQTAQVASQAFNIFEDANPIESYSDASIFPSFITTLQASSHSALPLITQQSTSTQVTASSLSAQQLSPFFSKQSLTEGVSPSTSFQTSGNTDANPSNVVILDSDLGTDNWKEIVEEGTSQAIQRDP